MDITLTPELRESVALLIRETLCIPDTKYMAIIGMSLKRTKIGYCVRATISVRNHMSEKAVWTHVTFEVEAMK